MKTTSTSDTIEKTRRNLLIVNCVLLLIALAGAKIQTVNIPGAAVSIERPEFIIYLIWAIFAYENWRFYLLSRPLLQKFHDRQRSYLNNSAIVEIARVGCASLDEHSGNIGEDSLRVERGFFRRKASFVSRDEAGAYSIPHEAAVSYGRIFHHELLADIKCLVLDAPSLEYMMPLALSLATVLVSITEWLLAGA